MPFNEQGEPKYVADRAVVPDFEALKAVAAHKNSRSPYLKSWPVRRDHRQLQ
jgi:hypothetical protein